MRGAPPTRDGPLADDPEHAGDVGPLSVHDRHLADADARSVPDRHRADDEHLDPLFETSPLGAAPALDLADREFKHLLRAQLFGKPAEPLRIGRFTVLRQLGAGGMGVVYAAYDDQLDRKVALKLLHADRSGAADQRRLVREAQALARLAHPNVVGIHEVGVFEGRVFLAMEFVHGQTAHAWRAARSRRWRDVLDVYLQAGRGLAAAHAVGLVHGDFKPENVLVGDDGRVRVLDFGLARASEPATVELRPGRAADEFPSGLSVTGGLAGTPAYMAPEQLGGARPDARSDQFAFCVALFEALYGRRPYPGASLDELARAVLAGRIAVPAGDVAVPGWLRRIVLRGLARDPAARWPAMPALLAALDRQPRRARWLAAAGLAAAVILALFAARERPLCTGVADELAGVWDPERRQTLAAAFARFGTPFAGAAWARTERLLDAHFAAWTDMARDSCEATHVRGTQSSALLDLRTACLRRRRDEVRALTDLFAAADAQVVARAVQAVGLLSPLEACADTAALSAAVPPPEDRVLRRRVERARARLAAVVALLRTGKYEDGRAGAQTLVDEALALGHLPLTAEVLALSGELHAAVGDLEHAERLLEDAARAAAAAGDDALVARAWTLLVAVVGVDQARDADGRAWARVADVAVVRAGDDPRLRAALQVQVGALARERGDHDDALARLRRALALQEQVLSPDDPALADTLDHIGLALAALDDHPDAVASHRRALALRERVLGPDHPDVAVTRQRLGSALHGAGDHLEADRQTARALAIVRAALPGDHPTAAALEWEIGNNDLDRGRHPAARAHFEAALAAWTRALGPDHPDTGTAHIGLGQVAVVEGRHDDARHHCERARDILERALGPDHPSVAAAFTCLGLAFEGLGRPAEMLAQHQRALRIRELRLGPDHPDVGVAHANLANAYHALGRLDDTLAHDQQALAIAERRLGPDHRQLAQRHANLALVLGQRQRHAEALHHWERALAILDARPDPDPQVAATLSSLGATLLALARPAEALPHLTRALAILDARPDPDPQATAFTQFALARALWQTGRDRPRARALARRAREHHAIAGTRAQLSAVDNWLRGK